MGENVIPIRKADKFLIFTGRIGENGEVIERERVGVAYLRPTSTQFRLRLWMFPRSEYFLAREDNDHFKYVALSRDEYEGSGERRTEWQKIGVGDVVGNFIRIRFYLFPDDIYLCLFPKVSKSEALDAV